MLLAVIGCGTHLALTGGSIPVGTSRLRGIVVRADNVSVALPSVPMALRSGAATIQRVSDAKGLFDFGAVPGGAFSLAIQPGLDGDLSGDWVWSFVLSDNTSAYMTCALWPKSFDARTIDHIALTPSNVTLRVGDSVRFSATAMDKDHQPIPYSPSLLLSSEIGALQADGTFQAARPGQARVVAWMAGKYVQGEIEVLPKSSSGVVGVAAHR